MSMAAVLTLFIFNKKDTFQDLYFTSTFLFISLQFFDIFALLVIIKFFFALFDIVWFCEQLRFINFQLFITVGWPILFLYLWGSAYQRGFFCNDTSLRHPFHESTVPSWTLYITGIGLNCAVVSNFLSICSLFRLYFPVCRFYCEIACESN